VNGEGREFSDEALGRRLAGELPRYAAPAALRARIEGAARPRPTRPAWFAPALSALATAAVFVLFVLPSLPATTPNDVVGRLVSAVVAEHTRVLLWGARRPDVITAVADEAGIRLARAFAGDDRLRFVAAEPVYLDWRRGVALHYRDADGHDVTYVVLPVPGMTVPDHLRVPIQMPDRVARPALVRSGGFATWVWRQGDLACFIVSDLVAESDLPAFKDYWIRLRTGTEPKAF
jgi:hypothetical protein